MRFSAQYPAYRFDVGWNLIGGGSSPFPAEYLDTLEQIVPPVYFYNTETSGYEAAEIINPLIGYWVLSTDSFTIVAGECDCPPTVTDIDGNVYETVLIGDQCWISSPTPPQREEPNIQFFYQIPQQPVTQATAVYL